MPEVAPVEVPSRERVRRLFGSGLPGNGRPNPGLAQTILGGTAIGGAEAGSQPAAVRVAGVGPCAWAGTASVAAREIAPIAIVRAAALDCVRVILMGQRPFLTVIVNEELVLFALVSTALQVTFVLPMRKRLPDLGAQVTGIVPS